MEEFNKSKKSRFSQYIKFIRDYRIRISSTKRLLGIGDTLIGWAFIAINTVFFPIPTELILSEISFVFFFFSGALALFLHTVYKHFFQGNLKEGFKDLLIRNNTQAHTDTEHLSTVQRIKWIYFRGFIATGGYVAYIVSKIYFGVIDNSEIFGADALVYALLAFFILHDVLNKKEILGITIASFGVFLIVFFDIKSFDLKNGLIAGAVGIISAIAMTIIFFINGIIVRHDTPQRVAFHQCIAGLIVAIVALLFTLLFKTLSHNFHLPNVSIELLKSSLISGVLYAIALVFFLRAFLRAEPIVIAVIGYSLGIFIILLEWLFKGELIGVKDGISALLIGFGCFLLIHQEYVKDRKKSRGIKMQKPIYEVGLKEELASLKDKFQSGELDRYTYLAEKHEFNKLLLEYVDQIKGSPIESIKILQDALVFVFKTPESIELETDGGARSAPFEILNFGSYEIEDELMAYNLLKDGDTIFDVGGHIGWYAINFAKRFPKSQIYAFEPIGVTFEFLTKNIKRNQIDNVIACNYGCSNKEEEKFFYYFKGGSALASIENLIDHNNANKVKCALKTIDRIVQDLKIQSVNFIKYDAEGSELFAIQGAEMTIKKFNPIIFAELYEEWCQKCGYSSKDVLKLLRSWGYIPYQAINGKLKEVRQFQLDDSERYNYFFLNQHKHVNLIEKYN